MKYGISEVKYEDNDNGDAHISKIKVYTDGEEKWVDCRDEEVRLVIENIKNGYEYVTMISAVDNDLEG